jgi:hypothetical protein
VRRLLSNNGQLERYLATHWVSWTLIGLELKRRKGFGPFPIGRYVAIFQLDVPEKYLTQLKKDRHAVFLTALALGDEETIIEIDILVLGSKEFVDTETGIKDAADVVNAGAIRVPWVERK